MRVPTATCRLQLTPGFGFRKAREVLPYLAALGISDLYTSPLLRPRRGSRHGYDVVDHGELNPDLGNEEDFLLLSRALRRRKMGWLLDIVPNHMAFDAANSLLRDVLENGPASNYFHFFDIEWEHYYEGIRGKVLAPFLGSHYGAALENGELVLHYGEDGFSVAYHDLAFPLRIESYLDLLAEVTADLQKKLGVEDPDFLQLLGVLYVLKTLGGKGVRQERDLQVRFIKHTLWTLYRKNKLIRTAIDETVRLFNGRPGQPESFNRLEAVLADQWFRLSFWKVATEEINYRRFFSINDLISLNAERPEVFDHCHALPLKLLAEEHLTGLRIDHVDGFYDPGGYLEQLREKVGDIYLVVEKILAADEALPPWPVQGTTGYDFLNWCGALFCRTGGEKALTRTYTAFTGQDAPFEEMVLAKKRLIIEKHMFGDINNLAHLLKNIASRHRYGRDITMDSLKRALIEIMAAFPVYRTYLDAGNGRDSDRRQIKRALVRATERNPGLLHELNYISRILLLQYDEFLADEERTQWLHFVQRFQQFTGPLMAKGFEDTLLYVYNRLLALNEVGGTPERFGIAAESFHAWLLERQKEWPHSLNATGTHDTKRGEDVRARLYVLSEIPGDWSRQLKSWGRLNRTRKTTVRRRKVPDRNDEYFLYQTLLGAWPLGKEGSRDFLHRIKEYLVKAVREAKVHTAWLKPDTEYEEAFLRFAEEILRAGPKNEFLPSFLPFQRRIARFGIFNSLAQTLLKITAPGIPDFYQGTELWDLSLVDPDNRRPVDFRHRQAALKQIAAVPDRDLPQLIETLLAAREDGRIKLFLIYRGLRLRNRIPLLFGQGEYLPLKVQGAHQRHVFAFARRHEGLWAVTVVPRFLTDLVGEAEDPLGESVWRDTHLRLPEESPRRWRNALTGEGHKAAVPGMFPLGSALCRFPVALLWGRE